MMELLIVLCTLLVFTCGFVAGRYYQAAIHHREAVLALYDFDKAQAEFNQWLEQRLEELKRQKP